MPPHNPPKLQKLGPLKEASAFTSGQVPCFCPGVTMKLVITTNELSPCGDTANELTAGTAFSDGASARSLSLGQGVGHPNHQGTSRQTASFSLTLGPPPSSTAARGAGGSPGELQCCQPLGHWRTPPLCFPRCSSGGTGGALILLEAASNMPHQTQWVPSTECFPEVRCGWRFVAGATCFPPQGHHVMVSPMESQGAHLCPSAWVKTAVKTKTGVKTKATPPSSPALPPYLGWENIIHHIPDMRAYDTLIGQRQAFQLHRNRADDAVLRLVALLVEEDPPGWGKMVG